MSGRGSRSGAFRAAAVVLAALAAAPAKPAAQAQGRTDPAGAQAPVQGQAPVPGAAAAPAAAQARPSRSVYGTLELVDQSASGIIMKTDDGKRVAWKFDKALVERLKPFKQGDRVIVIYRQRGADKAVTAVAFPGAAPAAIYHNTSGQRVELVGGPLVNGACGEASEEPVRITSIPVGGQGEVAQACWCCAPAGGMCIPANRTGNGQAFLANCYE